jgi:hypothetical protein
MEREHFKLLKDIITERGEIDLVSLKSVLKQMIPSLTDVSQNDIIDTLLKERFLCTNEEWNISVLK